MDELLRAEWNNTHPMDLSPEQSHSYFATQNLNILHLHPFEFISMNRTIHAAI